MQNKKIELKYDINGNISNRQNPETIKSLLQELDNGKSADELVSEHRLSSIKTLKEWQKRYGIGEKIVSNFIKLNLREKRLVVFEINCGKTTIEDTVSYYKVSTASVKTWIKLYSCDTDSELDMAKNKQDGQIQDKLISDTESKKLIEELKLKVLGLETMIDIAEEKFKIEIRKKSGTKQ